MISSHFDTGSGDDKHVFAKSLINSNENTIFVLTEKNDDYFDYIEEIYLIQMDITDITTPSVT